MIGPLPPFPAPQAPEPPKSVHWCDLETGIECSKGPNPAELMAFYQAHPHLAVDKVEVCSGCGEETHQGGVPGDTISYCSQCGCVEGYTHMAVVPNE